jgi:hypothetical protein
MSLGSIPLLQALPVQQLNVDPRLGNRVEPIIQMNNNSISSTNRNPADTYTIKVLRSSDPQSGHLLHTHTNGETGEDTIWLQYDKVGKQVLLPQSQRLSSPNHDITGQLDVIGDGKVTGNFTVLGSLVAPGYTPVITSLSSLDVANLRNTNMTSLNGVFDNLTVNNFISNTLISNLTVDNLFAQDGVFTNLTAINPINATLASYPSAYSALTITNLVADNFTNLNANMSNLIGIDAQIHHMHNTHLTSVNAFFDNMTLVNPLVNLQATNLSVLGALDLPILSADFLKTDAFGVVGAGNFTTVSVAQSNTALTALSALQADSATLATTATLAQNIQKIDKAWYCTSDALLTGEGTQANPISLIGALAGAKAYWLLNPTAFQCIYLFPGNYGNAGSVFTVDLSRLSIIGLGNKQNIQVVEGFDFTCASAVDANNELVVLQNLSIYNQATAGVPCVNFEVSDTQFLTLKDCFIYQDTGNAHAVDCNPTGANSRLYIDGCQIVGTSTNGTEVCHIRRGTLFSCINSSLTGKGLGPSLRVSNAGAVGAVDGCLFENDYNAVNAQNVASFEVAQTIIFTNNTVSANSANTSATGINLGDNAIVFVASNNQISVFGAGGKAINGAGTTTFISNGNNSVGVGALGQNTSTANIVTVNQTKV